MVYRRSFLGIACAGAMDSAGRGARRTLPALLLLTAVVSGCARATDLRPVPEVDLGRYGGDWCVIAHLPTKQERNAFDAVEHYAMREGGRVDITYTFREGAHDGPLRTLHMRGQVRDEGGGGRWWVRPFWPLRVDYEIVHLEPDYGAVVVAHPSRRYAWIMARTPTLAPEVRARADAALRSRGFDPSTLREVPWQP